jgi:preprotein translocase subunit YajC
MTQLSQLFLASGAGTQPGQMDMMSLLVQFLPLVGIFVLFYFMLIRPQRKREKATQEMRSKVEVGDEIVTAGGIIGRVVSIREDTIIIETGSDRSKIRIARWAIQANNTVHDDTPSA